MKITDLLGKEVEFDCLGCDISKHKVIPPGGYVYEDDFINISADPIIPILGFMVLGINKHVKSINQLTKEERYRIIDILNLTIEKIKECNISKEVLLIQEENSSHFHIWIVPIHEWMRKFDNRVENIDRIIKYAKEIYNEEIKNEILKCAELLKKSFDNYK